MPWTSADSERIAGEIELFLTGSRHAIEPDRVLATVMFADIVDSTQRAAAIGDRAWTQELQRFDGLARRELERFRGRGSTPPATATSRPSMARRARCAAPRRSPRKSRSSA